MAIVSSSLAAGGAALFKNRDSIISGVKKFFGGGANFAQQDRNRKRGQLRDVGFNWRKTSGVPAGEEWNIDNYSSQALDNLARLYDNFGKIAVDLHNEKKISSSQVAENYETLQQMALEEQRKQQRGINFFTGSNGEGTERIIQAGTGVAAAAIIAGGLFYIISRGS